MKPIRIFAYLAAALAAALCARGAASPYSRTYLFERGVAPIKAQSPSGAGYLMADNGINAVVLDADFIYGGDRPDLILTGRSDRLMRYVGTAENGAPIFAKTDVSVPVSQKKPNGLFPEKNHNAFLRTPDGKLHSLCVKGKQLVDFVYNPDATAFEAAAAAPLPEFPHTAHAAAAALTPNGGLAVFFVCSTPKLADPNPPETRDCRLPGWMPYDCNGISTTAPYLPHQYFVCAYYPKLLGGEPSAPQMVSPWERDICGATRQTAGVYLEGEPPTLFSGSRQGLFRAYCYNPETQKFEATYASDARGNALRHPNISAGAVAYKNKDGIVEGLIADGQGLVYYYPSLHKRDAKGAPLFGDPVPVMATDMPLYFTPLATPTAVDWDGDGVIDLLTGGAEGYVFFIKNIGTNAEPMFDNGVLVFADGEPIKHEAGYSGSVQGTGEARWGYISPTAFDWNGDGLPDLIVGDIRGEYTVYMNRGTKTEPKLDAGVPLHCDGLVLRGRWRCGAAAAVLDGKRALAIVDAADRLHLYYRIDDYNVEDAGALRMDNGEEMTASLGEAGASGRCKLNFADWDGDGKTDLIIGAGRTCAVPSRVTGYPNPALSTVGLPIPPAYSKKKDAVFITKKPLTTVLFVKNTGSDAKPVFAHPVPFSHEKSPALQGGGCHETGVAVTTLGSADGKTLNLIICDEGGRGYFIPHADVEPLKNPPHLKIDKKHPPVIERIML